MTSEPCPVCGFRSARRVCGNCGGTRAEADLHTMPSVAMHRTSGDHHHFVLCGDCMESDMPDQLQRFLYTRLRS